MMKNALKQSKMYGIIRDNKGSAFPLTIAITLVLLMVFVGISEYIRLMIIAEGVRDAVQAAIISTVNDNYADVYHSVREGYAAGYQPNDTSFEDSFSYGNVYAYLDRTLGLRKSGSQHIKMSGTDVEFKVYGLAVYIRNTPIAPTSPYSTEKFTAEASIYLEVPVRFSNMLLPPMKIKLNVEAEYIEIF